MICSLGAAVYYDIIIKLQEIIFHSWLKLKASWCKLSKCMQALQCTLQVALPWGLSINCRQVLFGDRSRKLSTSWNWSTFRWRSKITCLNTPKMHPILSKDKIPYPEHTNSSETDKIFKYLFEPCNTWSIEIVLFEFPHYYPATTSVLSRCKAFLRKNVSACSPDGIVCDQGSYGIIKIKVLKLLQKHSVCEVAENNKDL